MFVLEKRSLNARNNGWLEGTGSVTFCTEKVSDFNETDDLTINIVNQFAELVKNTCIYASKSSEACPEKYLALTK